MPSNQNKGSLIAWALYDWATSASSAVIVTFIFAAYFVNSVAANKTEGVALWGMAIGLSGLAVAVGAPILGAMADQIGARKRWLAVFTCLCILCIALMWFVLPSPQYTLYALFLIGLTVAFTEYAYIFYNAMLPELAGPERIGRWSGWGWASGYAGGVVSLILCLLFFANDTGDWHGLDRSSSAHIRATFLFVAAWYALFSLPLFLFVPADPIKTHQPFFKIAWQGFKQLKQTLIDMRAYQNIYRFLIARMIFTDALITLFAFGGIYAATTFQMGEQEVIRFGIALNISGGIGACLFAFLDDSYGGKRMIIASLIGLIVAGSLALLAPTPAQFWFWGICIGLFIGPAQASSRSFLARVTPPELRHQMFGFFALSAKMTAFLGPLFISWVTYWTGSFRAGMSTIIVFLCIGLLGMLTVKNDK